MKALTIIFFGISILTIFTNCSTAQKLQKEAPIKFGETYCQSWVAGVQGGGSGINLFIPVVDTFVVLDSVYFRGKTAKLETKPQDKSLYIAYFKTEFNQPKDIVMSSNPFDEYNNPLPIQKEKIPFTLKDSECVVSYKDGQTTKYFKIENIVEKEAINYPSAPNNKH